MKEITTLGQSIRAARRKHDLTQGQLAEKMGLKSVAAISNWETGISQPSASQLIRLTFIFGRDIYLFIPDFEKLFYQT